jgi:hypothetical protein
MEIFSRFFEKARHPTLLQPSKAFQTKAFQAKRGETETFHCEKFDSLQMGILQGVGNFREFRVSVKCSVTEQNPSSFWRFFGILMTWPLLIQSDGGFNAACGRQFNDWALPNAQEVCGMSYNREFDQEKILYIAAAILVVFLVITYWMYNPKVHSLPPVPESSSETTQK